MRFVFGGAVTAATGLIATRYGPGIGGLFLAFPAILPASLTLLKAHDGRDEAARAAAGSRLGAIALIAFGGVASALAAYGAPIALAAAVAVWAALACGLWAVVYGRSRRPRGAAAGLRTRRARRDRRSRSATSRPTGAARSPRPAR